MTDNITGKTILLTCNDWYGYDVALKKTLLRLGAKEVTLINLEPIKGSFRDRINFVTIYNFFRCPNHRTKVTNKLIQELGNKTFDVMLCMENMKFSKFFLDFLRSQNPNIKLFLFLWDTFDTQQPRYKDYLSKFDYVYTFDKDDAKRYQLKYFPDFYLEGKTEYIETKYDLCFVGSIFYHSTKERASILYTIKTFCEKYNLKSFLYLKIGGTINDNPSYIKRLYRKIRDRKFNNLINKFTQYGFIHYEALTLEQFDEVCNQSKVIIDLNHRNRQGMTINAITALAKGKKLITTNKRIKEEPFYDPNVIYILDDENPQLDIDFFNSPYKPVDMSHLRLDNWLKHILND